MSRFLLWQKKSQTFPGYVKNITPCFSGQHLYWMHVLILNGKSNQTGRGYGEDCREIACNESVTRGNFAGKLLLTELDFF